MKKTRLALVIALAAVTAVGLWASGVRAQTKEEQGEGEP